MTIQTQSIAQAGIGIGAILQAGVTTAPAQTIHDADGRTRTYAELSESVTRHASALDTAGIGLGATVAVMDFDTSAYLECFFSIPMLGTTLHTINLRLTPEQPAYTINHAKDDVIIVNRALLPLLAAVRDQIGDIRLILTGEGSDDGAWNVIGDIEALKAKAPMPFAFPEIAEDTRATLFYTTGTTGLPKGVHFTHRQLVLHTLAVAGALAAAPHGSFDKGDVYMPLTPMFHVHAWGIPFIATMLGVKQVYPGRFLPDVALRLIAEHTVSYSHCVPTILQMMLEAAPKADVSLDGWKTVIGGSALPVSLATAAMAQGVDLYTGYGMSETGPVLTLSFLTADELTRDPATQAQLRALTGRPIPMVSLRIVDGQLQDVPHDGKSQGEIVVRAPWLTADYVGNAEASRDLWAGGWLHTGDIGVIDPEGRLRVTDRIKDVVKTGGEWVSSLELEEVIRLAPGVADVAVIAVPDAKWGERPLAVLVPESEAALDAEVIEAVLRKNIQAGTLSRYAIPERFEVVEALPKTSVGKIDKKVLRQTYPV